LKTESAPIMSDVKVGVRYRYPLDVYELLEDEVVISNSPFLKEHRCECLDSPEVKIH
jgi:hypothetical protein